MTNSLQPRFDRVTSAIARVRETCDGSIVDEQGEAELELAIDELDAALVAARTGSYRPSQRDAIAALELAIDFVRTNQGNGADARDLDHLIQIGLDRLKRMGL